MCDRFQRTNTARQHRTASPTSKPTTPGPTTSMSPATSRPSTCGYVGRFVLAAMQSAGLRPTALTFTRTCADTRARCRWELNTQSRRLSGLRTSPGAGEGTGHAVSNLIDETGPSASITHAKQRRDSPTNQWRTEGLEGDGAVTASSAIDAFSSATLLIAAGFRSGTMGASNATPGTGRAIRLPLLGVFPGEEGEALNPPPPVAALMVFPCGESGEGMLAGRRTGLPARLRGRRDITSFPFFASAQRAHTHTDTIKKVVEEQHSSVSSGQQ